MQVFDLDLLDEQYYIKRKTIVEKIQFNNRTFYAKFERVDEPLTPLLVKQHQNRQYSIAVPLLKNNRTNYLVIEYKGDEHKRFHHLIKHLFNTINISKYTIYQGKDTERLQVFIPVKNLTLEEADAQLHTLSNALKEKMTKKWKCLPSITLPEDYNIVSLPYKPL